MPRTANPEDRPWQITNDLIYNAGVWRNGGADEATHLCDECIRIGLRAIKMEVDRLLEVIEAGRDKDQEIARLTERLGLLQFHHQSLVYSHNRMQARLGKVLEIVGTLNQPPSDILRVAQWEVSRGPEEDQFGRNPAPESEAARE